MKKFLMSVIALLLALTACEQAHDGGGTGSPDSPGTEEHVFAITGGGSGPLKRGGTWVFAVNPQYAVTWTVEGNTDSGTAIIERNATSGRLTIGENETNRTLTVKAASVENPQVFNTVTVTVDGLPAVWTDLTAGLEGLITNKASGWKTFHVGVGGSSFGIKVLAYGNGRWVAGGGSDDPYLEEGTAGKQNYPALAYSDDDGDTWTKIHTSPELTYEELPQCLIYDGPAEDKKFILSTERGSVFWSVDGIMWTRVTQVLPGYAPADSIDYLRQVLYGDIGADGGTGIYLVLGERGRYTWSRDGGKTWAKHYADTDWRYAADCNGITIRYGSGVIDGKRVKMFFGAGYKKTLENKVHSYSLDGENWVTLNEDTVAAVDFKPNPPAGANKELSWLDETDTSALLFAPEVTEPYAWWGKTGVIEEGPGVNTHAEFVAYGNGKYLAVGLGRRLARTDAETARKQ
jgi:hypothetical protein